jgi:hypothetical protein
MPRFVWGTIVVAIALSARPATAKDGCPPGFYYDRQTIACEQEHCPPGAGRTYTHECNCGEAWGNPFRTCAENGLVTHCVPKDKPCDSIKEGFDVLTGGCKDGFLADAAASCTRAFPKSITCKVVDIAGKPLAGKKLTFGEYKENPAKTWTQRVEGTSGADGTVRFSVIDQRADSISFFTNAPEGARKLNWTKESQPECLIYSFDEPTFEAWVAGSYADLLRKACFSEDEIKAVTAIPFEGGRTGTPRFSDGKIEYSGVLEDPAELLQTAIHEYGHGISKNVLDTWKEAGGPHNNWVPVDPAKASGWAGTPETVAFEEALADFMAMLHFRDRGQTYQGGEFEDSRSAERALDANGMDSAARTEGVITTALWDLYRPIIESGPDGPAKALADLRATIGYPQKAASLGGFATNPVRTIRDFLAQRVKRAGDAAEKGLACGYSELGADKVQRIGEIYGLTPRREVKPALRTDDAVPMAMAVPDVTAVGVHVIPKGAEVTIDDYAADYGKVSRFRAGGDVPTEIEIEADGQPTVRSGTAVAIDGPARTVDLNVVPMGTELVVTVAGDKQTVLVAHGGAEVVERAGQGRRVTLTAGQAVDWTAAAGFAAVRDAAAEIDRLRRSATAAPGGASGRSWKRHLPWLLPLGGGLLLVIVLVAIRSRL